MLVNVVMQSVAGLELQTRDSTAMISHAGLGCKQPAAFLQTKVTDFPTSLTLVHVLKSWIVFVAARGLHSGQVAGLRWFLLVYDGFCWFMMVSVRLCS